MVGVVVVVAPPRTVAYLRTYKSEFLSLGSLSSSALALARFFHADGLLFLNCSVIKRKVVSVYYFSDPFVLLLPSCNGY